MRHPPVRVSLLIRRPPTCTLFPCTTLFRSLDEAIGWTESQRRRAIRDTPRFNYGVETSLRETTSSGSYEHYFQKIDADMRSEEHTSELQSRLHLVCRLLLEKKNAITRSDTT